MNEENENVVRTTIREEQLAESGPISARKQEVIKKMIREVLEADRSLFGMISEDLVDALSDRVIGIITLIGVR